MAVSEKDMRLAEDLAAAVSMEIRDGDARDRLLAEMTDTTLKHRDERTSLVLALTHSVLEKQGELY